MMDDAMDKCPAYRLKWLQLIFPALTSINSVHRERKNESSNWLRPNWGTLLMKTKFRSPAAAAVVGVVITQQVDNPLLYFYCLFVELSPGGQFN